MFDSCVLKGNAHLFEMLHGFCTFVCFFRQFHGSKVLSAFNGFGSVIHCSACVVVKNQTSGLQWNRKRKKFQVKRRFNYYFRIWENDSEFESFAFMCSMVRRIAMQCSANDALTQIIHNKYAWHRLKKCSSLRLVAASNPATAIVIDTRFKWKSINTNEKQNDLETASTFRFLVIPFSSFLDMAFAVNLHVRI